MANWEELEARVTAVEGQLADVRQDATAARVLAGAADRDVPEFRQALNSHTKVLNALRQTQVEYGAEMREFETEVREFRTDMREFRTDMREFQTETREGFAKVKETG